MNGIVTAHRVLNGQTQTVIGIITNTAISWIRNGMINNFGIYLADVKPSSVTQTVDFIVDDIITTPSSGSSHTMAAPFRVYFHVIITGDSYDQIADEYFLYADVNTATAPEISGYKQMNDAFDAAQHHGTETRYPLNDPKVFVDTIIFKG